MELDRDRSVLVGVAIVVGVIVATVLAMTQSGKDGSEPFEVAIVNDSGGPVRMSMCEFGDCGSDREIVRLADGAELRVPAITDSNPRPWRISDADGSVVGCLPFVFATETAREGLVVPVSDTVPCGSNFGADSVSGPDWPPSG